MDTSPIRRFIDGVLAKFGGFSQTGEKESPSVDFLEDELPPLAVHEESEPGWPTPDGGVMHARWKGHNATVWWPLKEGEEVLTVCEVNDEGVVCDSGTALYEFFIPALLEFVHIDEVERARRMRDLGNRLRVSVSGYRIVSAGLVPRDQARSEKDIA